MAYIGKQPVVGNFVKLDAITTSATATYNLLNGGVAYFPQTANNCIVSLNGVIQSPTSAYTISGSTIIFSDALTASDTIDFILVLGDVLSIGTPSDGTVSFSKVTSNLITGATAETSIAGGDSILIYDDSVSALRKMTRTNFVAGIGGTNTPNFWVYMSTNQSVPTTTFTTVQFNAELFDTANAFNTSTYTYTIPSAGKYFFGVQVRKENSRTDRNLVHLRVNGTQTRDFETGSYSNYGCAVGTTIENLSASDAITIQFYHDRGSNQDIRSGAENSFFYGYKLIT